MAYRIMVLLALACVLGACGSPTGVQEIIVDGSEFKFQPSTIQVVVGRPVRLTFRDSGVLEHDWSIAEIPVTNVHVVEATNGHTVTETQDPPQLHIAAAKGKTSILEFTPTRAGTFDIICNVPGHKEAGMIGKLIVKDN